MWKRVLLLLVFYLFTWFRAEAIVYYSRTSGNWNSMGSWSTVTYGSSTNSGTYPGASDTAMIGDGVSITITANQSVTAVSVGTGTSGILQFNNGSIYTFTVSDDIIINSGGKFWYNSNSSRSHILNIGGDLTNNGTIDFYYDSNDLVNITFNTSSNSIVSGSGTWDLNNVTLNKTSSTNSLTVNANGFETIIRTLTTTSGNYIHNNSGTFNINASSNYQIDALVTFTVPSGTVKFANSANYLYLQGSLIINGGTVYVGSSTGTQGIRNDQSGSVVSYLEISSGSLIVYGGINLKNTATPKPLYFKMTGGTVLLNSGSTGVTNEPLKIADVTGSVFEITAGTITIEKKNNSGGSQIDIDLGGSTSTVNATGGWIQCGDNSTPTNSNFNFKTYTGVVYPNMRITGPSANGNQLLPSAGTTINYSFLGLEIGSGSTFDNRSITGTPGDSKQLSITSATGFTNNGTFTGRSGIVNFSGTSQQPVSGSTTTNFYDVIINNTSGVVLNAPVSVTNYLTLSSGTLTTTSTNLLTITSSGDCGIGSAPSFVDGPMVRQVASNSTTTLNFPVGKNGIWRPNVTTVNHSNTSSVDYWCQLVNSPAAALSFTLPASLSRVSLVRYWQFVRTGASNFTSATMKLYYGPDDGVTDCSNIRVAQGIGTVWNNHGGTGTANGTGTITSSSFTSFNSIFTIGNATGGSNPLPVNLISFTAEKKNSYADLNWITASEINNDYFLLERSSDGEHFQALAKISGSGNTSEIHEYGFIDSKPLTGNNFYRIKQVDYDGQFTFSDTRRISFVLTGLLVYPTLSKGNDLNFYLPGQLPEMITITIFSVDGAKQMQQKISLEGDSLSIDLTRFKDGKYLAYVEEGDEVKCVPIIIMRH